MRFNRKTPCCLELSLALYLVEGTTPNAPPRPRGPPKPTYFGKHVAEVSDFFILDPSRGR